MQEEWSHNGSDTAQESGKKDRCRTDTGKRLNWELMRTFGPHVMPDYNH